MSHSRSKCQLLVSGWAGLFAGLYLLPSVAAQELSTVYLLDGRGLEGSVDRVTDTSLHWKLASGVGSTIIPLASVDRIEFPQPDLWQEVMAAFEEGKYKEAESIFVKISKQRTSATYYPAPGNFATLSERRLLDCYRQLRDFEELRYIARKIEWDKLPRAEREAAPLMACWAAIGGSEWDEALKLADIAEEKSSGWASELGLIRALSYKGKGEPSEAVVALAEIFGPYPGLDRDLAREALMEASTILANDPERKPELTAMVHTYAALYGRGDIWEGASSYLEELLSEDIAVDAPSMNKGAQAQKKTAEPEDDSIYARYVRVEMPENGAIQIAEVEVFTEDGNIAPSGDASQNETLDKRGAAKAIDGNTAGAYSADTFSSGKGWWELDLKAGTRINTITIWGRTGRQRGSLDGFDLVLLDGSRQEVFSKRDNPFEELNLTIQVNPKKKPPAKPAEGENSAEPDGPAEK